MSCLRIRVLLDHLLRVGSTRRRNSGEFGGAIVAVGAWCAADHHIVFSSLCRLAWEHIPVLLLLLRFSRVYLLSLLRRSAGSPTARLACGHLSEGKFSHVEYRGCNMGTKRHL